MSSPNQHYIIKDIYSIGLIILHCMPMYDSDSMTACMTVLPNTVNLAIFSRILFS